MSPKIVNGSFAAIYDHVDVLEQFSKTIKLRQNARDSPAMRRRIKGILMSGKQFSLDSHLDLFHGIEAPSNRHSMVDTTPLIEDEESNSGLSDSSGGKPSPNGNGSQSFLDVPQQRRTRSKSVDHHYTSPIENSSVAKSQICTKCGHDLK
ncbi:hypothetical protein WA026_018215 [Henosepilachna vigintioctopunctata]|uniref:Uncharacterized protein n=1 Tax=Henosepilachna vigintioctopunctata TaxID=420089 RepID=A0AAW1VA16_9CUCU